MNAMPLPFEEFQGKGFPLDFSSSSSSSASSDSSPLSKLLYSQKHPKEQSKNCYVGCEPTSVLDARRSPSPPTSSSTTTTTTTTLSSSLNSGDAVAASLSGDKPSLSLLGEAEELLLLEKHQKCGGGVGIMEDWESVLSEASPGHEHSILRLIMGDVDDPSLGLNKLLHASAASGEDFNAGFGVVEDQQQQQQEHEVAYGGFESLDHTNNNNLLPVSFSPAMSQNHHSQVIENFSSQMVINQNQANFGQHNTTGFLMPLTYAHLQNQVASPPPPKRLNTGGVVGPSFHAQKSHFLYAQQQQQQQNQLQLLSQHHLVQSPKPKSGGGAGDEQLAMADQLSKAAELIETGSNPILAQGILARLNHQLTTTNPPPLYRACFYFKEALQLLINTSSNPGPAPQQLSPFNLILKIGAHKTFSEISPAVQFANFTSNQAILEATEGFPAIHVVDFDIALGSQWASLMQELALRNHHTHAAMVSLKITAFASTHEADLELGFTHDNLRQFAADLGLPFDLEILPLDALASWGPSAEATAIAVNLPLAAFSSTSSHLLPLALRFAKQLSPKILVALERGCDSKAEAPFPVQVAHSLGAHAALLESLDAVNAGPDAVQKIERALVQPGIEKMVLHGARRSSGAWRGLVASVGFAPASFSNFAESQAECLVQRTPARGFHVEKRQSSLVLCWQRKELVTLSAWR